MERLGLEDNTPDIEVLEGQMTVEELLADLGVQWLPEGPAGTGPEAASEEPFSQPALFKFQDQVPSRSPAASSSTSADMNRPHCSPNG